MKCFDLSFLCHKKATNMKQGKIRESLFLISKEARPYLGLAASADYRFAESNELTCHKRGRLFFTRNQPDQFIFRNQKGGVCV